MVDSIFIENVERAIKLPLADEMGKVNLKNVLNEFLRCIEHIYSN